MARATNQGLEYFPIDVHIFRDKKLESLNHHRGPLAEIVYIRLLAMVYENGYYLEKPIQDIAYSLQKEMGANWVKLDRIFVMIHACVEAGLFDEELSRRGVITSKAIQKQFLMSTKRRHQIDIGKHWLLDQATMLEIGVSFDMPKIGVFASKTTLNFDNNSLNVDIGTQSKSKRDKEDKLDKSAEGAFVKEYLTKTLIESQYLSELSLDIGKFDDLFATLLGEYDFELVRAATRYIVKYSKNPSVEIDDRFDFFKASIVKNLRILERREEITREPIEDYFRRIFQKMDQKS
jgi:hypothetical protein